MVTPIFGSHSLKCPNCRKADIKPYGQDAGADRCSDCDSPYYFVEGNAHPYADISYTLECRMQLAKRILKREPENKCEIEILAFYRELKHTIKNCRERIIFEHA